MSSGSPRTRSHSNSFRSRLIGRFSIVLLVVALLTMLGFVHLKYWPWLMSALKTVQVAEKGTTNLRLYCTISDEISRIWAPHATALLEFEEENHSTQPDESTMRNLLNLPGVKDVFYINLQDTNVCAVKNIIPDSLMMKLDMRGKKHCGGAAQMMRRLVGGLTRFRSVEFDERRFPLMVRYVGTYYPDRANEVIGLVLDEEWFIDQIPAKLDSLAKNSTNLLFMAPQPPDTQWFKDDDPYKDIWKQTMGVLHGTDTLWWYGDRNTEIYHYWDAKNEDDLDYGYVNPVPEFNLKFLIKTEFPLNTKKVIAGIKSVKIVFPLIEIVGIVLVITLIISIYLTTRQASRNQIALAHLAHAVKTPVARMRLSTDSLLKDMATSPQEEREIVEEISQECDRLETAVRGAAVSLEGIGKRLSLEKVELSDELAGNVERWKAQYSNSGVDLQFEKIAEPVSIQLDRNLFSVMVDNLLDNALRHTLLNKERKNLEDARVIASVHTEGKYSIMTIDDSGGGIPKSERKRLFKRFQRVADDAATGVSGLGLGLALVKEIAQAHNGEVSVGDNNIGGSRFIVRLPLSE